MMKKSKMNTPKSNVLIVEDEVDIRNSLKDLLDSDRYEVFLAENGWTGMEMLQRIDSPCVIILDLQMPVMDGYGFLLRKNADPKIAHIPVIVVSATPDRSRLNGVTEIIPKPFDISEIKTAVERICGPKH